MSPDRTLLNISFARQDRLHDSHPRLARNVRHYVVQSQIHLLERLLHMLDVRRRALDQHLPLSDLTPQYYDLIRRAIGCL
jgi:hypothetical protein